MVENHNVFLEHENVTLKMKWLMQRKLQMLFEKKMMLLIKKSKFLKINCRKSYNYAYFRFQDLLPVNNFRLTMSGYNLNKGSLNDLEAFQIEKQAKLNEIWVVVPLQMKQLDFQDSLAPEDIPVKKGLVVPQQTIARLNKRIDELMVER